jgi:4-hydroxy-3-methylbut-2-enyl diphosphate reductase IspH
MVNAYEICVPVSSRRRADGDCQRVLRMCDTFGDSDSSNSNSLRRVDDNSAVTRTMEIDQVLQCISFILVKVNR